MMKYKIIILISLLFISCRSKKTTSVIKQTDTIKEIKVIKIDKPQLNEIVIDNICDSLGKLKPILYTYTTDNVKTSLKSIDNSLKLDINIDSIVNSRLETYKSSIKEEKKENVIEITPLWIKKILGISLLINAILIYFGVKKILPSLNIFR